MTRYALLAVAFCFSAATFAHDAGYVITASVYENDRLVSAPSFTVERTSFAVIAFPKDEDNGFRFSAVGIPKDEDKIQVDVNITLDGQRYAPTFLTEVGMRCG